MRIIKRFLAVASACCIAAGSGISGTIPRYTAAAVSASAEESMEWGTLQISGGGFVSGIVTGQNVMYARTDVGGAYKYHFETETWEQMMSFITEQDKGYLSVDAMCIDPTDDDTVYMLCGCAYFSDARTAVFKTTDGGETWTEHEVTDLIQVHGNGYGRQNGEAIAVDPDHPNIIYCGGDVNGLIWSQDGGETWEPVEGYNDLGFFRYDVKWPTWTDHMAKAVAEGEYYEQNGVAAIKIYDGKVYVATSVTESGNVVVADVGFDDFQVLSDQLPADCFPSHINQDAEGNLLITYCATISFGAGNGGIYRYNTATGAVEDISPEKNSFGACMSDPENADCLIATTLGVWSIQRWDATGENDEYGEWLYRSEDGGKTWTSIYPGKEGDYYWNPETGECKPTQLYDYLDDGGCDWIYGKAIHWSGALVVNPNDPTEIMVSSGNGVFKWDDIWTDDPKAIFHAKGIEEVVAHDFVSIPGGDGYSVIYDYDGFRHTAVDAQGVQFQPNMGSTLAIAYCPQNPDVLIRCADKQGKGYYTLDGGNTWTEMSLPSSGGKAAIAQIGENSYRFFKSEQEGAGVSYSDDFGQTWQSCQGIQGSKTTYLLVEPENPQIIYAYTTQYNAYWSADLTKTEPTFEDAHYSFYISRDGGKTFTGMDVCRYDECDQAGRIAYLGEDNLMVGGGWYGMYHITNGGRTIEQMDVYYCKSIGYGAPEKEGDLNTLYMWGMPSEDDAEGIYRSQDGGSTWTAINTTRHYGGTGNGNFIVGDMNEFGTVYMSTVGMGIVYGRIADDAAEITEPTDVPALLRGDVNQDGEIGILDVIYLSQAVMGAEALTAEQADAADCNKDNMVTSADTLLLIKYIVRLLEQL